MDSIRKQKLNHAKRTTLSLKKQQKDVSVDPQNVPEQEKPESSAPYTKILLEWTPKEFYEHKRSENWYLWLGIITAIFITVAIFTHAYIVAITFFLLAIVLVMFAQQSADTIEVKITDTGILYNGRFYAYHGLEKFWILYNPPQVTRLHVRNKLRHLPDIRIEIENEDPVAIRDILLEYLPEDEEKEEDFTDTLARRLRF